MSKPRNTSSSNIKFLNQEETIQLYWMVDSDTSRNAKRNKAIFHLAKYCALRASEIGLIGIDDYNPLSASIHCRRLKGSKNNTLTIIDPVVLKAFNDYFWEIRNQRKTGTIFLSQKGKPINRRTLDYLFKFYCRKTNIPQDKHHFHVLKHTRAMELIEYPFAHLRDVQWWLGHKNISNTMIYLDYTSVAMKNFFSALAAIEGAQDRKYC